MDWDKDLNESRIRMIENKVKYILTQIKFKDKSLWGELSEKWDEAETDDIPTVYKKIVESYQEL